MSSYDNYLLLSLVGKLYLIYFILFYLVLIIFRKPLYGLGVLFIIPTLFFYTKYNRLLPPPTYMNLEVICATYTYEGIDIISSSRGERPKLYYFLFDNYGEFSFRNNIKDYKLDFSKLSISDKVCFTLQRNMKFENNLRRAKIIQVEKKDSSE